MKSIHRVPLFLGLWLITVFSTYGQRFAIIGDYGLDGPDEAAVANMIKSWDPEFIITLGDNNYPYGEDSTIDINIGKHYHSFIAPYRGDFGEGAKENRFFPTLGNHDDYTENGRPYLDYFELPGNERYYDFVKGDIHFFALNSNPSEPDGVDSTSVQARWLKRRLANSRSPWKVVYFHHPPYSTADHGDNEYMQWPFSKWGASAVLSGHDHVYERLELDGVTYLINGLGGHETYGFVDDSEREHQVRSKYNRGKGAILATVTDLGLHFEFHSESEGLIEEFTLENRSEAGLFTSQEIMELVIEAPLETLLEDRGDHDRKYHDGKLYVKSADSTLSLDIELKVRGNFRRFKENCEFTPFWIRFPVEGTEHTRFQGYKRLKIVNPCGFSAEYHQYVMQEYLGYRIYNQLTDSSFRVRPLEVKYVHSATKDTLTTFSFFIENNRSVEDRLWASEVEFDMLEDTRTPNYHNPPTLELFQFMIGNNDWGIPDHNVKVFQMHDDEGHLVLPYDFDLSRLVNASYSFKEDRREFKGFCRPAEEFDYYFEFFNDHKPAIERLYHEFDLLEAANKQEALRFIDRFYKIINHPERRKKEILDRCSDDF